MQVADLKRYPSVVRGGFLGLLVALTPGCLTDPGYEPPVECATDLTPCERSCVDLGSDLAHCGACNQRCSPGAVCSDGQCRCGGGLTSCESGCVDTASDPSNCGACAVTCGSEQVCSVGSCVTSCRHYESACSNSCVDLNSNAEHCGGCDDACSGETTCAGGSCECRAGTQRCGDTCADLRSDEAHCGACDAACSSSQVCQGGRCTCPGGLNPCPSGCADLLTNADHCGACDNACAEDEVCSGGHCRESCPPGLEQCNQSCIDTLANAEHCGSCEVRCSDRERCVQGECQCAPGTLRCGSACIDVDNDRAHCGGCGLACAPAQLCRAGQCECPTGTTQCGSRCVNLDSDPLHCGDCETQCEQTEVCSAGTCGSSCSAEEEQCDSVCSDPSQSEQHCGGCGQACAPGFSCDGGSCACLDGSTLCAGACVNTSTSSAHCGACGSACAPDESCIAGSCRARNECSDTCPHDSGITWRCQRRFMHGVNYAWQTFAGDFGGIPAWDQPGVLGNEAAIDARLAEMASFGVDVVRWWVWPDFRGDGVRFDSSGTPSGLGATAIADLERALELAERHDLHLMLTLFSFDNFRPSRRIQDLNVRGLYPIATQLETRIALIDRAIRPFASAAEAHPHRHRLIAWDVINEPEWAIRGPSKYCDDDRMPAQEGLEHMSHDEMEAFLADIIAGLRAESSALVTVGGAATFWACAWRYLDLDFYQFHIYDWVDEWRPFESSPSDFGIFDKPAIIGEFPLQGLQRAGTAELLDTWYQNGWAGALGWAVTERGSGWNESQADLRAFATQHPCQTHY